MEILHRMLFREPDGRNGGLVFIFLSFICLLGLVYFGALLDGPYALHFIGISLALIGFAETMPSDRQRSAGVLRILGLGIVVVLLVLLVTVPESILI